MCVDESCIIVSGFSAGQVWGHEMLLDTCVKKGKKNMVHTQPLLISVTSTPDEEDKVRLLFHSFAMPRFLLPFNSHDAVSWDAI